MKLCTDIKAIPCSYCRNVISFIQGRQGDICTFEPFRCVKGHVWEYQELRIDSGEFVVLYSNGFNEIEFRVPSEEVFSINGRGTSTEDTQEGCE